MNSAAFLAVLLFLFESYAATSSEDTQVITGDRISGLTFKHTRRHRTTNKHHKQKCPAPRNFVSPVATLNGAHLNVGLWLCSNQTVYDYIIMRPYIHFLDELGQYYNFTYSKRYLCAGGFAGALRRIKAGKIDLICDVVINSERGKQVRFLNGIVETSWAFVIKMPETYIEQVTIFAPFDYVTWLLILASAIVVIGVIRTLHTLKTSSDHQSANFCLDYLTVYVFGTLVYQGGTFASSRISIRLLQGCWWSFVIVLIGIYAGTLVSFLSVKTKVAYPFTTLQEATESEYTPVVVRDFVRYVLYET